MSSVLAESPSVLERPSESTQASLNHRPVEPSGDGISRPPSNNSLQSLVLSVDRMIYQLCNRFSGLCNESTEDLAQDCVLNILKKIEQYDPSISRFTTWSWHVCHNLLVTKARRARARRTPPLFDDEVDRDGRYYHRSPSIVFEFEIKEAVRALVRDNPKSERILFAMLGNPMLKTYRMPQKIKVSEVARLCNVPYQDTYLFYKNVVKPFFRQRFGEEK